MSKKWKALRIKIPSADVEAASAALWELGTIGILTESENPYATQLIAYFDASEDLNAVTRRFYSKADAYKISRRALRLERVRASEKDWLARWRDSYKFFLVGEKFLIGPTWGKAPVEKGWTVIRLDTGMAFGSGTHESTQLCLLAIERYYRPGVSFLDMGTGSGILAIAAAKLLTRSNHRPQRRERSITAIDEDPQAIDVARRNIRLNRVSRWITLRGAPLPRAKLKRYDFIVANLTAKDLTENAGLLFDALNPNGYLTLSGILLSQKREVLDRFKKFPLTVVEVRPLNEWVGILLKRDFR